MTTVVAESVAAEAEAEADISSWSNTSTSTYGRSGIHSNSTCGNGHDGQPNEAGVDDNTGCTSERGDGIVSTVETTKLPVNPVAVESEGEAEGFMNETNTCTNNNDNNNDNNNNNNSSSSSNVSTNSNSNSMHPQPQQALYGMLPTWGHIEKLRKGSISISTRTNANK
mmetsp:Transcript_199/g.380  ORF Transcript_199/g.380 Transcript_199/m.380 type:complete len:168 (-) Transcript_199:119-622(-)